ncbi:MAG TPA: DUF883 family protein [Burkholderiales bacterium]|jgi:ElaB/YqjD/DUF883 family membrane-anchored ribosome-binding protein|nr:DUF883 family protein [Burkholderiales bacterium]
MDADVNTPKDKLVADFKAVIRDAEELLQATANQAGEKVTAARGRIQESLRNAKEELQEIEAAAMEKARVAARATDAYVHQHPWQTAGIAAAVGIVIGMLIGRNR